MAFTTKQNLVNDKFYQADNQTLTLSGDTRIASVGSIAYASDQTGSFTPRSLVDKGYVTGVTSLISASAVTGATNGLTKTGKNIKLGGTITGDTNIVIAGNNDFTICSANGTSVFIENSGDTYICAATPDMCYITALHVSPYAGSLTTVNQDTPLCAQVLAYTSIAACAEMNAKDFTTSCSSAIKVTPTTATICGDVGFAGAQYCANYSANFTPRSLVDKGYVTGLTSAGITSANNGLTKSETNVRLGGSLTGDTRINVNSKTLKITGGTTGVEGGLTVGSGFTSLFVENYRNYVSADSTGTWVSSNNSDASSQTFFYAGPTYNMMGAYQNASAVCNRITMQSGCTRVGSNAAGYKGFQYYGNYRANFVCNSLVDAAYVTGLTTTSGIQTAENGLTKVGTKVKLGGTITGTTTISDTRGTPRGIEYGGNYGSTFSKCSLVTKEYVTGLTSQSITSANNGLTKSSTNVRLGGSLTGNTTIGGSGKCLDLGVFGVSPLCAFGVAVTGVSSTIYAYKPDFTCISSIYASPTESTIDNTINGLCGRFTANNGCALICGLNSNSGCETKLTFTPSAMTISAVGANFAGAQYNANYSANFTPRSLVDKGYVTGLTSAGITSANNGLTKSGANVRLGGALTGNTIVNPSGYYFDVANTNVNFSVNSTGNPNINVEVTCTGGFDSWMNICPQRVDIYSQSGSTRWSNIFLKDGCMRLSYRGNDAIIRDYNTTPKGLLYYADYSGSFVNESLVTKRYVTGLTTSSGIQTAENGLTKVGTRVKLGGAITGDTTISSSSHDNCLLITAPMCACDTHVIGFHCDPTISGWVEGQMYYQNCALNFMRETSGVTLQIGEETVVRVVNNTGSLIPNGRAVYICGAQNGVPEIALAIANNANIAKNTLGLTTQDIALGGGEGYVTLLGKVNCINTNAWAAGCRIYLSPTTAGCLTATIPTYPNEAIHIGYVTCQSATVGSILVVVDDETPTVTIGQFTGYTASTAICLAGKMACADFDSYTGTTTPIINGLVAMCACAITGVTNGLTKVGAHCACLGGSLSAPVTISGTQTLTLGDLNGICLSTANTNDIALNAKSNGSIYLKSQSGTVASSSDFTTAVGLAIDYNASTPMQVIDCSATPRGLQYAADYSTSFCDRSLVDKYYVDSVATGLNVHGAVVAATTASDGNITLSGSPKTIDGVSLTSGMRVLIKNQTQGKFNGIYVVTGGTWSRSDDYNFSPSGEISNGDLVPVISGVTNANSQWINVTENPITSGDTLTFSLFAQQQGITEGNGICVTTVGSNRQVCVKLSPSNSGLCFDTSALELDYTTFRKGLNTLTAGKVDVNACSASAVGTELCVKINTGGTNVLYIDSCDVKTALGTPIATANNGLTKSGCNVRLGGALTGDTTITGAAGTYDLSITGLDSFNLGFDNTSTITDGRGTPVGLEYAGDYKATFATNSLVSKGYVDCKVIGGVLAGNGLTKGGAGDTVILGGTLTGNTSILYSSTSMCFGGTYTCIKTDCAKLNSEYTKIQLSACTNGSCAGSVTACNTGVVYLTSNAANCGVRITAPATGAVYTADYSGGFVNESLVTKRYVTGLTTTAGVQTASNGLTKVGTDVRLGGTLTGSTTVSLGTNDLYFSGSKVNATLNDDASLGAFIYYADIPYVAATQSMSGCTRMFVRNSTTSCIKNIGIDFSGLMLVTDNQSCKGLEYAANYCANNGTNPRWIPDAAWVTGKTSTAGVQTANNGLTKSGTNVRLGGTLTGNTQILGVGKQMSFGSTFSALCGFCVNITGSSFQNAYLRAASSVDSRYALVQVTRNIANIAAVGANGCGGNIEACCSGLAITANLTGGTFTAIQMNSTNQDLIICSTSPTFAGAQYAADYSANFTNCSLVTKEYVDGAAGGIGGSNGLTRVSDNITLGGVLTGNTQICTDSANALTIGDSAGTSGLLVDSTNGTTPIVKLFSNDGVQTCFDIAIEPQNYCAYMKLSDSTLTPVINSCVGIEYEKAVMCSQTQDGQFIATACADANTSTGEIKMINTTTSTCGHVYVTPTQATIMGWDASNSYGAYIDTCSSGQAITCVVDVNGFGTSCVSPVIMMAFMNACGHGDTYWQLSAIDNSYCVKVSDASSNSLDFFMNESSDAIQLSNKNGEALTLNGGTSQTRLYNSGGAEINMTGSTLGMCGTLKICTVPSAGSTSDSVLVRTSTGLVRTLSVGTITGATAISANNGLTKSGSNIRLGGALTGNTTITGAYTLNICSGARLNTVNGYQISGVTVLKSSPISMNSIYVGACAGQSANDDNYNTAVGEYALRSTTTGYRNVAIGACSMTGNTGGAFNIAVGTNTLAANTTGCENTAIGASVLCKNTTGGWNTAIGTNSMFNNTIGEDNVAVGDNVLFNNISGHENIGMGYAALNLNTTGCNNTGIGRATLRGNTTGHRNVGLGTRAGYSNSTGCNNVFLGNCAGYSETGSNKLYIANSSGSTLIYGDFATSAVTLNAKLTLGVVPTVGSASDSVLVRNSGGEVRTVSGSLLGDKNNIYAMTVRTSNVTLTTGDTYVQLVNSPTSGLTITLPATPINGQVFRIKDAAPSALSYNITVARNGKLIDNAAANAVINTDGGALELVYNNALGSWFVFSFVN